MKHSISSIRSFMHWLKKKKKENNNKENKSIEQYVQYINSLNCNAKKSIAVFNKMLIQTINISSPRIYCDYSNDFTTSLHTWISDNSIKISRTWNRKEMTKEYPWKSVMKND